MRPLTATREALLDTANSDETFRQLINDLLAFSAKLETIRAGFGKLVDLTGVEYTMIVTIGHLETSGPVFVNALADHMHLSGAFVTLQTNKLAKKGLLKKVKDPEDGRRVMLQLTKKSLAMLDKLADHQCRVNDVMFGSLNSRDFQKLAGIIGRLVGDSDKAVALVDYMGKE